MKKCQYCKAEFEPKNPKGKFCSDKCRVYASRKLSKDNSMINDLNQQSNGTTQDLTKQPPTTNYSIDTTIKEKIAAIKAEKIPKERDTIFGRKIWQNEQNAKIAELMKSL